MTPSHRAMAALLAMLPSAAAHASNDNLVFQSSPSPQVEIARQAMSAEAGRTIDAGTITVSTVDLDGDGTDEIIAYAQDPYFCNAEGCAPRILRREGDAWRNVLSPDVLRTRAVPGSFTLVGTGADSFSDILVGSMMLVWDGAAYVEDRGPVRTELDAAAFVAACRASPTVTHILESKAIPGKDEPFCACMAEQFQVAGLPQSALDRAAQDYGAPRPDTVTESFLIKVMDFELGCRIDLSGD